MLLLETPATRLNAVPAGGAISQDGIVAKIDDVIELHTRRKTENQA